MGKDVYTTEIKAYQSLRREGFSQRQSAEMVNRAPSTMRRYEPFKKPTDLNAQREVALRRYLRRALTNELNSAWGCNKKDKVLKLKYLLDVYPDLYEDIRQFARKYVEKTEQDRAEALPLIRSLKAEIERKHSEALQD